MHEDSFARLRQQLDQHNDRHLNEPMEWPPADTVACAGEHAGLRYAVARGPFSLCGYVHVPATHRHANSHNDQVDASVHGGLTFFQRATDGGMWFGFDTGHAGDWLSIPDPVGEIPGRIWTVEEVENECRQLADQLAGGG